MHLSVRTSAHWDLFVADQSRTIVVKNIHKSTQALYLMFSLNIFICFCKYVLILNQIPATCFKQVLTWATKDWIGDVELKKISLEYSTDKQFHQTVTVDSIIIGYEVGILKSKCLGIGVVLVKVSVCQYIALN